MAEKLPYLFLDIDGVMNPYPGMGKMSHWPDFQNYDLDLWVSRNGLTTSEDYSLRLSRLMGDALNELPVEIWWCTTWEDHAYKVGNIVGIDADYLRLGPGWKRAAVEYTIEHDPRPFVWFEDEPGQYGTLNARPFPDWFPERYVYNPPHNGGLDKHTIDAVASWLNRLDY
jgi:hypothetical protein